MTPHLATTIRIGPAQLSNIVSLTARQPQHWQHLVRYDPASRWYCRLTHGDGYEIWLLSWLPGQRTGFHDHGPSAGAFAVALGSLAEQPAIGGRPAPRTRTLVRGDALSFGAAYAHDVRNDTAEPALSVHAYSPPLTSMSRYSLVSDGTLRVTARERSW